MRRDASPRERRQLPTAGGPGPSAFMGAARHLAARRGMLRPDLLEDVAAPEPWNALPGLPALPALPAPLGLARPAGELAAPRVQRR